jgi:hypothetical protein
LNDGRVIEHGSGLVLHFIEPCDAADERYLTIDLDGECMVALEPRDKFKAGLHSIDWVERKRKFTLTSTE